MKNILSDLINFNTTQSNKNEKDCALYIHNYFKSNNIQSKIYEPFENRCTVTAFTKGRTEKTLILHCHIDTADYMEDGNWLFPYDKASIIKGCICGRGSLDCKSQIAVFMQIMKELDEIKDTLENSVLFIASADEENDSSCGLRYLIDKIPEIENAFLCIGEGGGFPVPYNDKLLYTIQTNELTEEVDENLKYSKKEINNIIDKGIKKGYFSPLSKKYALDKENVNPRKIQYKSFYYGLDFDSMPYSNVLDKYAPLIEKSINKYVENSLLIPIITPGYSDNRFFRRKGIDTLGFFPLDIKNPLGGIHGVNEYISEKSLILAYNSLHDIIFSLLT